MLIPCNYRELYCFTDILHVIFNSHTEWIVKEWRLGQGQSQGRTYRQRQIFKTWPSNGTVPFVQQHEDGRWVTVCRVPHPSHLSSASHGRLWSRNERSQAPFWLTHRPDLWKAAPTLLKPQLTTVSREDSDLISLLSSQQNSRAALWLTDKRQTAATNGAESTGLGASGCWSVALTSLAVWSWAIHSPILDFSYATYSLREDVCPAWIVGLFWRPKPQMVMKKLSQSVK